MARIYPKIMPDLLDEEDEEQWLMRSFDDDISLAKPFPLRLQSTTARQDAATGLCASEEMQPRDRCSTNACEVERRCDVAVLPDIGLRQRPT